ncbi:MAG: aspartate ammonia-lyase [Candidatus Omnitrophica bacterium]|nr:aspartate ammonia-lyase [Candidatus Omnitrophota bacterium]
MEYRIEKDFLGEKEVPLEAYWGIHTQRAIGNFSLTDYKADPLLVKSLAFVKKASCQANLELGYLGNNKAQAIIQACEEVSEGRFNGQFPLDALQGGAGTSTNMNANEVIANRAIELLGGSKGDYSIVSPTGDVNLHQSTNDVYPTALKIACIFSLRELSCAIEGLQGEFQKKEKEFADMVKVGRTELQEAVPMTLGLEFGAFAEAFARDRWRTFKCEERLRTVNLGGTAIGTGITAPKKYIFLVIEKLRQVTGLGLARGENVLDLTANSDSFVEVSATLKACAVNMIKICGDLRLLNLLGEISLPKVQAGSSIMPEKVNPVILEAAIQGSLKVLSNDTLVAEAVSRSSLQIPEFIPLLAFSILESMRILANTAGMLKDHVGAIKADEACARKYFDRNPMIITAFLPLLGYEKAGDVLEEFFASGKENLREFLITKLGKATVDRVLSAQNLTSLGYREDEQHT